MAPSIAKAQFAAGIIAQSVAKKASNAAKPVAQAATKAAASVAHVATTHPKTTKGIAAGAIALTGAAAADAANIDLIG